VLDLALERKPIQPTCQLVNNTILESSYGIQIDFRWSKLQPVWCRFPRFGDDRSQMEKRLGRNTSPDQARTSEAIIVIDDGDRHPEIGSSERGSVSAGTSSDD